MVGRFENRKRAHERKMNKGSSPRENGHTEDKLIPFSILEDQAGGSQCSQNGKMFTSSTKLWK